MVRSPQPAKQDAWLALRCNLHLKKDSEPSSLIQLLATLRVGGYSDSFLNPFIYFLCVNFIDDRSTLVLDCFINYICCFSVTAGGYCHPCGIEKALSIFILLFYFKTLTKMSPTAPLPSAMEGPPGTVQWSEVVNRKPENGPLGWPGSPSVFCFGSRGTDKAFQCCSPLLFSSR